MKPIWILENNYINEPILYLRLQSLGYKVEQLNDNNWKEERCAIFRTCINTALRLSRHSKAIPGVYLDKSDVMFSNYMPYVRRLLNKDGFFMCFGNLKRNKEMIFNNRKEIFIRPNSGLKITDGIVLNSEDFDEWYEDKAYLVKPTELFLVAPSIPIISEFRYIFCDNVCIAGSQYYPKIQEVNDFARVQSIFLESEIRPNNRVCVLDTARSNRYNGERLIEFNSFTCAGLYACNLEAVISHVSKAAQEEFEEFHE